MADLISLDEQRVARMTPAERRKHDLDQTIALLDKIEGNIDRAEELLAQSRAIGLKSQANPRSARQLRAPARLRSVRGERRVSRSRRGATRGGVSMMSALDEAIAIALSAKGEIVDRSREPLTQRERRIRARYLENELADGLSADALACLAASMRLRDIPVACDLAEAARRAGEQLHDYLAQSERERIEAAIADLDDEDES